MNSTRLQLILMMIVFMAFSSFSQQSISGRVIDKDTKEGVYGARIDVNGMGKAKTADDGSFSLKLTPGTYTISASQPMEAYIKVEVELIVVNGKDDEITLEIGKDPSIKVIEQAVVTATKKNGKAETDEDADNQRIDKPGTSEILSSAAIKRSGVSSAVGAVQMTPGASVQDGKNVFIRGLGGRYTKTVLNGMEIPGLDPDRNSVQMDIFPAVILNNISVYKSFTPNLMGDFTGGLIDIQTKDFPAKKMLYFKASLGYNTRATFNPDYISYQGGKIDFLGFDDGGRQLTIDPRIGIPHPSEGDQSTHSMTSSFGQTMATQKAFSFMNQSYSFAIGNQKKFQKIKGNDTIQKRYGYNAVLNYRNTNTFYEDVEYNEYLKETDPSETRLFQDRTSKGELAQNDVMWTALIGQSLKVKRSKYSLVLFHTQNGTSSAATLTERNFDSNQAILVKEGLQYTQRSISNANLGGIHFLDKKDVHQWKLNWNLSPTYSSISDPDIRSTALEISDQLGPDGEVQFLWEESVGAEVRRIYRSLSEYNISGKIDLEHKFRVWKKRDSLESKLAFGVLNTYKNRSFDVSEYVFRLYGVSNVVPNDPNWFFQEENLWTPETGQGTYATGQQEKANIYQANQNITSAYAMHSLPLDSSFSVTYGVRAERSVNRYTGQSTNAEYDPSEPRYNNQIVLDQFNVLPSLNMVYKIRKEVDSVHFARSTNFRAAYTQTVARPSFREISISQIYDPIQGRRYLGNIDLLPTLIHNVDLRWEHFFGKTELISASAFYKKFINPIEVVANVAAPNEFKPVNAGEADVYGAEFEIRKSIGFNKESKKHISLVAGTNFAYILSLIDMNKVETIVGGVTYTEKEVREANARDGEVIGDFRPMYGQSPYVINAFLNFRNDSLGLTCNLSYNVQGKKLAVIGVGLVPDVYEQPFHSLNFTATMKVGKFFKDAKGEQSKRWTLGLKGTNLLNNARRRLYESYEADSQIFDYLNQGMTITGSVSYSL